ncbi:dTDP-4-amino-4,6-dideoxygalactose transaminase [Thermosyntropha sp.]|uniref:dTDP-4-amino-4,6-dideoxygalactose transaminase n=1 Tax=Thermosyntropha sp. TaxID=2740820 RepID=UPI0025DE748E|nr:dTDP-4-amino-4,6-dideoxygalactose transaminase [Thermosyntropha sp.]MBO8159217.1 dTDP-4-amino-4,6-dideoxygalactose transaminase [Thermosyntropha sp.]
MKIPFNQIYTTGREIYYINNCIKSQGGQGKFYTKKVQDFICGKFKASKVLLTTSCTAALEMAALLVNLGPEDEVIMPSFTFTSTANAVMLRGAKPVFADIDGLTLNISPEDVEKKITSKTKAVIPVHYAGIACDMDKLLYIAKENGLFLIEDAAQAVNALYKDRYLGTIGHIGCYSFHATKNYTCGEGGAILLNNIDPKMIKRAEYLWEKGTNRQAFLAGMVDKYTWVDVGSSYTPADLLAAYLYAQMEELDIIYDFRRKVYERYYESLLEYEKKGLIRLPFIPSYAVSNYHIFYLLFTSEEHRNFVKEGLNKVGIEAVIHYMPLHLSPMGRRLGYKEGDLPVTEKAASTILRLPLYPDLTEEKQEYILKNLSRLLNALE